MVWSTNQSRVVVINSRFLYLTKFHENDIWSYHGPERDLRRSFLPTWVTWRQIFFIFFVTFCFIYSIRNWKSSIMSTIPHQIILTPCTDSPCVTSNERYDRVCVDGLRYLRPPVLAKSGRVTQHRYCALQQVIHRRFQVSLWCRLFNNTDCNWCRQSWSWTAQRHL